VAIGEWVAQQPIETLQTLGVTTARGPDESTIRRVFGRLDAGLLEQILGAFMWTGSHTATVSTTVASSHWTVRPCVLRDRRAPPCPTMSPPWTTTAESSSDSSL